jgi:glycosyltransferase involved in cell wall biosynthesis
MGHFDILLARFVFPHTPLALDHLIFASDTARDRGAGGIKVRLLRHLDRMALNRADLVIVDTQEHQHMLRPTDTSMVIPVGAPDEWYAAAAGRASTRHEASGQTPNIVFYGLFTPLQGTPVIAKAIRLLAERGVKPRVSLVGTGQDFETVHTLLSGLNNVEFIPWIEPERLPSFVAGHDISLGIFSDTPKGLHVVPNKVYQSMAAGTAVITSDTPPQRRMLGDGVSYTQPGNAEQLADAIESLAQHPDRLARARAQASTVAATFTEREVTKQLAQWLQSLR